MSLTNILLDPLTARAGNEPEEEDKAQMNPDPFLEEALADLKGNTPLRAIEPEINLARMSEILSRHIVATPRQIELLLSMIIEDEGLNNDKARIAAGFYLSGLMQSSSVYGGYKRFKLQTGDARMSYLGSNMHSETRRGLILDIYGGSGLICGFRSNCVTYNVHGIGGPGTGHDSRCCTFNLLEDSGDYCGELSEDSVFDIKGSTGINCGRISKGSKFRIRGDAGRWLGLEAVNSTFDVFGEIGPECGKDAKACEFMVHNKANFEMLCDVIKAPENHILLKDSYSRAIVEHRYT